MSDLGSWKGIHEREARGNVEGATAATVAPLLLQAVDDSESGVARRLGTGVIS
jgi:hypothetical protein